MNINIDYKELKDYESFAKGYEYDIYEILQDRVDEYLKSNRKNKIVILNLKLMKEYNMSIVDINVYGLLLSIAKDIGLSNINAIDITNKNENKKKYMSITNYQISELLGISLSTVKRSLNVLKKNDLIEMTHTNNKVTNRIILI